MERSWGNTGKFRYLMRLDAPNIIKDFVLFMKNVENNRGKL